MYRFTDSRTATLNSRKKPCYDLVLMTTSNNGNYDPIFNNQQPHLERRQSESNKFSFGTNFNTNYNTEYNNNMMESSTKINKIISNEPKQQMQQQSSSPPKVSIPRIPRNQSYRFLYRLRSSTLNNKNNNRRKFPMNTGFDFMPTSNLIRLFGESSVPGVRDIALSQSFVRRMFWICSFFFFGFLALRDISQLVSEYYTYPITVDVRLRDSRRLQFPAVTVCNINIVRYSALCMNESVIKDSMIPRDLREKLCGQPLTSLPDVSAISSTTTPLPIATTIQQGKLQPTTRSPTTSKSSKPKPNQNKISKTSIRTTTMAPTQSLTNSDSNDGLDDINTYGVASNFSDSNTNETQSTNETDIDYDWNSTTTKNTIMTTISSFESLSTSTTTMKPLDDIPNDIAGPIDIQLDRPKRKVKQTNDNQDNVKNQMNSTASNMQDNQKHHQQSSATTSKNSSSSASSSSVPIANFDNIELTEKEEKELQENLTNWLAVIYNSNEKIAKQIGHQFEDLVLRCTIRSTNCAFANSFEHFFTPTEGNCFTFKSQNLRKTNLERIKDETSIAGVNYGLELVLNLEISEYLIGTAQIGAIVMIQHPDEIGNSASEAIFVAPKQSTYIGMKMVNISRLPKPFPEECIDHWPAGLVGRLTQNASYSQQACLKICLQRTIHTRCQCQSAQLPQLELNSTLKICDTRRKVTRNCVEEVMFQAEEKVSTCKCPPRCQVINYDKTVSMTKWPTREDRVTFDRGKDEMNFQNLAKVTVYFQTMTCQEVRQEKAYTTAKLFSSLGGILGMYVGFSFLSLFEIIEIFGRRFWYIVTKKNLRFRTAVHTIRATIALKKSRKINADRNKKIATTNSINRHQINP